MQQLNFSRAPVRGTWKFDKSGLSVVCPKCGRRVRKEDEGTEMQNFYCMCGVNGKVKLSGYSG